MDCFVAPILEDEERSPRNDAAVSLLDSLAFTSGST